MDANEANAITQKSLYNGNWIDNIRLRGTLYRIKSAEKRNKYTYTVDTLLWFGLGDPDFVFPKLKKLGYEVVPCGISMVRVSWRKYGKD